MGQCSLASQCLSCSTSIFVRSHMYLSQQNNQLRQPSLHNDPHANHTHNNSRLRQKQLPPLVFTRTVLGGATQVCTFTEVELLSRKLDVYSVTRSKSKQTFSYCLKVLNASPSPQMKQQVLGPLVSTASLFVSPVQNFLLYDPTKYAEESQAVRTGSQSLFPWLTMQLQSVAAEVELTTQQSLMFRSRTTPTVLYWITAMSLLTREFEQRIPSHLGEKGFRPWALWTTVRKSQDQKLPPSVDQVAYTVKFPPPKVAVAAKLPSNLSDKLLTFLCRLMQVQSFQLPFSKPFPWKGTVELIKHTWITEFGQMVIS